MCYGYHKRTSLVITFRIRTKSVKKKTREPIKIVDDVAAIQILYV